MDRDVVLNKLESLRRCIKRVEDKTPATYQELIDDYDLQDIVVFNLERAVQKSVDIGLHIISDLEMPPPETMAETFKILEKAEVLDVGVAERMSKAVGFRNTAVHAYQELDWHIVFNIATLHLKDFKDFAHQILGCVE